MSEEEDQLGACRGMINGCIAVFVFCVLIGVVALIVWRLRG